MSDYSNSSSSPLKIIFSFKLISTNYLSISSQSILFCKLMPRLRLHHSDFLEFKRVYEDLADLCVSDSLVVNRFVHAYGTPIATGTAPCLSLYWRVRPPWPSSIIKQSKWFNYFEVPSVQQMQLIMSWQIRSTIGNIK